MTVTIYLRMLSLTVLMGIALALSWGNAWCVVAWLAAMVVYLLRMLADLIELDHFDQRALPDDRGLLEISNYPPMPRVEQPFRFVGSSERGSRDS